MMKCNVLFSVRQSIPYYSFDVNNSFVKAIGGVCVLFSSRGMALDYQRIHFTVSYNIHRYLSVFSQNCIQIHQSCALILKAHYSIL